MAFALAAPTDTTISLPEIAAWTGTETYAARTLGPVTLSVTGQAEAGVTFPFAAYVAVEGDTPELVGNYRTMTAAKIAASAVARNIGR